MTQHTAIKIFEEKRVRTVWDDQQEKWYFCINDAIAALADCKDPVDYFKKVRKRDPELDDFVWGTILYPSPIYIYSWETALCQMYGFAECITISAIYTLKESRTLQTLVGTSGSRAHTSDAGSMTSI